MLLSDLFWSPCRNWSFFLMSSAFLLTFIASCGRTEPARIPGGGSVSLPEGSPENFAITFVPTSGVAAPSATTIVKGGKYQFNKKDGPAKPGVYRIVIQEPVVPVPRPERMKGAVAKKERNWNFEFSVPDKGPFSKDFELK